MRHLINTAILLLFATLPATAQSENQPKPNVSAETLALYEPGEFKGVKYRLMKPIDSYERNLGERVFVPDPDGDGSSVLKWLAIHHREVEQSLRPLG